MHQDPTNWDDASTQLFTDREYANDVSDLLRQGDAAFAAGRPEEAEARFKAALRIDPFEARPHERLSMVYWSLNRIEDALNSLTKALELDPNDSEVVRRCIRIFRDLGRTADADQVATSYLERNPGDTDVRAMLSGAPAPSTRPVTAAPAQDGPETGRFFLEHGERQFERGNLLHARVCFELAVEQDPSLASAHNNLGVLSWQEGKLDAALEHFSRAFDLNSEDREIIYNSARALQAAGQYDTAADLYRVYLGKDNHDPAWQEYDQLQQAMNNAWVPDGIPREAATVYAGMSRLLHEAGDQRGALEAMQRAERIDPGNLDVVCDLAQFHADEGNDAEALDILMDAISRAPGHSRLMLTAGRILIARERYEDARELLESAQALAPNEEIERLIASLSHSDAPGM